MEEEDDMVNVNVNTKACHDFSLLPPRKEFLNKSEIKPAQTGLHFHNLSNIFLWVKQ